MSESSPDLPGFEDLSLYDVTTSELVERAVADAETKWPDWSPRAGNHEVVLMESLALVVDELVFAINRLPRATAEGVLRMANLARDPGVRARGRVEFVLADALGHLIPAGVTLRVGLPTGETVDLLTVEQLEVLAGTTVASVEVEAVDVGGAVNGLAAGTAVELVDSVPYVETAALSVALSGGRDPEDDASYRNRGSALLSRLTSTLVLPNHFTAAALEAPTVGRATTISRYQPSSGAVVGNDLGHVTVAVADPAGVALPASTMTALGQDLTARATAGLAVHVVAPTVTTVPVTCTVVATPGADAAGVQAAVQAAIVDYLSPASWAWGQKVHRNELIALIDRVPGVARVDTITAPAADVTLSGVAPLAKAGTVAVTVTS